MRERQTNWGRNPTNYIEEIVEALGRPRTPLGEQHNFSIVTALASLEEWIRDAREYEKRHKPYWQSILSDVNYSSGLIGKNLKADIFSELSSVKSLMSALEKEILNKNYKEIYGYLRRMREKHIDAIRKLKKDFESPSACAAAWDDLVEACRDPASLVCNVAHHRDLFLELVVASSRDDTRISSAFRGILEDSAFEITAARVEFGEISADDVEFPHHHEGAGLEEEKRIQLCRNLLLITPRRMRHVVWIAYEKAALDHIHETIGQIQLWDGEWVRGNVESDDSPNRSLLPSELLDTRGFFGHRDLPEGREVVLVRVDLGDVALSDPVNVARQQAKSLLSLAFFRARDRPWKALDGHVHAINGQISGLSSFHSYSDFDDFHFASQSSIGREVNKIAGSLQAHFPVSSPELNEMLHAADWLQQSEDVSTLASVLLNVRVLELVSVRTQAEQWRDFTDEYLKAMWIFSRINNSLADVVYKIQHAKIQRELSANELETLAKFKAKTFERKNIGFISHLNEAVDNLDQVVEVFPRHGSLGRKVRTVNAHTSSVVTLAKWVRELQVEWNSSLARLYRIRNSLAHGGPVEDAQAENIRAFARQLARWSVDTSMQALMEGKSIFEGHEEEKAWTTRRLGSIETASSVREALYRN